MSSITNKEFWIASFERALKTFVQALLALFLADQAFNVLTVDWGSALSVAASATVLSFLSSIVSSPVGPSGSPSLIAAPPATPPAREAL